MKARNKDTQRKMESCHQTNGWAVLTLLTDWLQIERDGDYNVLVVPNPSLCRNEEGIRMG